jgi:hypothetical protein
MNHHQLVVLVLMLYHLVKLLTTHLKPILPGPDMVPMYEVLVSVLVFPVEVASNHHHTNHHQLVVVSMLSHLVKLLTTHLEPMPHGPDMVLM